MIPDDYFASGDDPNHIAIPRRYRERANAAWRRAQRFEFSPAASTVAGRLRHEAPELIIKHREFAIPPYTTMYVEFDSRRFMEGVPVALPVEASDVRVGYMIDGQDIFVFSSSRDAVGMTPWYYRLGESDDHMWYSQSRFTSTGQKAVDWKTLKLAVLLGRGAQTDIGIQAGDDIRGSVAIKAMVNLTKVTEEPLIRMLTGSMGDLANWWTFLLWLNQPKRITYTDQPHSRRISKGKLRVYSAYRTVDIELGKARTISRAFLAGLDRTPSRRHDVRGSFHHHKGLAVGCGHEWVAVPEREQLWECCKCQRRRWWVKPHERGDLSRGRVVHDYAVSAGDRTEEAT